MFDAFYPGYGSEWPTLQGGLGVLWEQASPRGLVIDRDDETKLTYSIEMPLATVIEMRWTDFGWIIFVQKFILPLSGPTRP